LYTAPAVRARLADPSFLKARRELVSKLHTQRSERWIRAEDLRFALAEVNNCEVTLEKALIEHQVALVALVESGATPEEWQRGFLRLTAKDQLLAVPDSQRWEQWIWYGAFPGSSTRNALYKTVKEKRPEFLRALAEYYVESWKAEAVKPEPNAENAIVLFEHPEVQAYYLSLDVAAQDEVLELLRGMSFDIGIRGLLAAPPYAR
jgi:hypothetical protein